MKKLAFMFAAAAMFAACQQKGNTSANTENADSLATDSTEMTVADTLVYEGEGPAADGTYKYSLAIYGENPTECDYEQIAVTHEGTQTMAKTTGLASIIEKDGKKYIRVSENKMDSVTFLQLDDTTLRLVSPEFEEAASGINTDLKLKK